MKRVRVEVRGFVQGVGFRYATADRARMSGVGGFVRNRPDGTVEAAFEGDDEAVDTVVDWCRRGPRGAHVEDVAVDAEQPQGETDFRIR
jgi:acylphosphatase